jgi:UDP-glucose 4-epimerase
VNEIFSTLKQITGYGLDCMHGPAKVGETRRIYLDASKARRELNWSSTVDLAEGLKRTVEYFKSAELVP